MGFNPEIFAKLLIKSADELPAATEAANHLAGALSSGKSFDEWATGAKSTDELSSAARNLLKNEEYVTTMRGLVKVGDFNDTFKAAQRSAMSTEELKTLVSNTFENTPELKALAAEDKAKLFEGYDTAIKQRDDFINGKAARNGTTVEEELAAHQARYEARVEFPRDDAGTAHADTVRTAENLASDLPNVSAAKITSSYFSPFRSSKGMKMIDDIRSEGLVDIFGTTVKGAKSENLLEGLTSAKSQATDLSARMKNGAVSADDAVNELSTISSKFDEADAAISRKLDVANQKLADVTAQLDEVKPVDNFIMRTPVLKQILQTDLLKFINVYNPLFRYRHVIPDALHEKEIVALKDMCTESKRMIDELTEQQNALRASFKDTVEKTSESLTSSGDVVKSAEILSGGMDNYSLGLSELKQTGDKHVARIEEPSHYRTMFREDKYARERDIRGGYYNPNERALPINKGSDNPEVRAMQIRNFWGNKLGTKDPLTTDITNVKDNTNLAQIIFGMYKSGDEGSAIRNAERLIDSGGKDRGKTRYGLDEGYIFSDDVLTELQNKYKVEATANGLSGRLEDDPHFRHFYNRLEEITEKAKTEHSPERYGPRHAGQIRYDMAKPIWNALEYTQGKPISPAVIEPYITTPLQNKVWGLRTDEAGKHHMTWRTPVNVLTGGGLFAATLGTIGGGAGEVTGLWDMNDGYRPQAWMSDLVINDGSKFITGTVFGANDGNGYGLPVYDFFYGGDDVDETPEVKEEPLGPDATIKVPTAPVVKSTLADDLGDAKDLSRDNLKAADAKIDAVNGQFDAVSKIITDFKTDKLALLASMKTTKLAMDANADVSKIEALEKQITDGTKLLIDQITGDKTAANTDMQKDQQQIQLRDKAIQSATHIDNANTLLAEQVALVNAIGSDAGATLSNRRAQTQTILAQYSSAVQAETPLATTPTIVVPDPAKADPAKADPAKADPAKADPADTRPSELIKEINETQKSSNKIVEALTDIKSQIDELDARELAANRAIERAENLSKQYSEQRFSEYLPYMRDYVTDIGERRANLEAAQRLMVENASKANTLIKETKALKGEGADKDSDIATAQKNNIEIKALEAKVLTTKSLQEAPANAFNTKYDPVDNPVLDYYIGSGMTVDEGLAKAGGGTKGVLFQTFGSGGANVQSVAEGWWKTASGTLGSISSTWNRMERDAGRYGTQGEQNALNWMKNGAMAIAMMWGGKHLLNFAGIDNKLVRGGLLVGIIAYALHSTGVDGERIANYGKPNIRQTEYGQTATNTPSSSFDASKVTSVVPTNAAKGSTVSPINNAPYSAGDTKNEYSQDEKGSMPQLYAANDIETSAVVAGGQSSIPTNLQKVNIQQVIGFETMGAANNTSYSMGMVS